MGAAFVFAEETWKLTLLPMFEKKRQGTANAIKPPHPLLTIEK